MENISTKIDGANGVISMLRAFEFNSPVREIMNLITSNDIPLNGEVEKQLQEAVRSMINRSLYYTSGLEPNIELKNSYGNIDDPTTALTENTIIWFRSMFTNSQSNLTLSIGGNNYELWLDGSSTRTIPQNFMQSHRIYGVVFHSNRFNIIDFAYGGNTGIDIRDTLRNNIANSLIPMGSVINSSGTTGYFGIRYDPTTRTYIFDAETTNGNNTIISTIFTVGQDGIRFLGEPVSLASHLHDDKYLKLTGGQVGSADKYTMLTLSTLTNKNYEPTTGEGSMSIFRNIVDVNFGTKLEFIPYRRNKTTGAYERKNALYFTETHNWCVQGSLRVNNYGHYLLEDNTGFVRGRLKLDQTQGSRYNDLVIAIDDDHNNYYGTNLRLSDSGEIRWRGRELLDDKYIVPGYKKLDFIWTETFAGTTHSRVLKLEAYAADFYIVYNNDANNRRKLLTQADSKFFSSNVYQHNDKLAIIFKNPTVSAHGEYTILINDLSILLGVQVTFESDTNFGNPPRYQKISATEVKVYNDNDVSMKMSVTIHYRRQ